MNSVRDQIEDLLLDSGFCEDLFYITKERTRIIVMFDCKEAVDYFRGDFEYHELSQKYRYQYAIDGKRHCAVISKRVET